MCAPVSSRPAQDLDLESAVNLPPAAIEGLAAATRLRRLSLRRSSIAMARELWPAVRGLAALTRLDVSHTWLRWCAGARPVGGWDDRGGGRRRRRRRRRR